MNVWLVVILSTLICLLQAKIDQFDEDTIDDLLQLVTDDFDDPTVSGYEHHPKTPRFVRKMSRVTRFSGGMYGKRSVPAYHQLIRHD